jgi:uncharacterized protein YabN with tetrapyrrole methylase and pyrophosphatase domain
MPEQNEKLNNKKGSLTIVGAGIQAVRQLTLEARQAVELADKVLYLISDPLFEIWLKKMRPDAESLRVFYKRGKLRIDTYRQMTETTLKFVREGLNVCEVVTGHPGIFVDHTHDSIKLARSEGYIARMFPGISSEDCFFADFGIDPAKPGCQTFEATDFLIRGRRFDTSCHIILLQIGAIGEMAFNPERDPKPNLKVLTQYLKQYYTSDHIVFLYEAAEYAIEKPVILQMTLSELPNTYVTYRSTLYIPPNRNAKLDYSMVKQLGMSTIFKPVDINFSLKKLFRL